MSKKVVIFLLVGLVVIISVIIYFINTTASNSLPYGQLTPESEECHLIKDKETCEKSGCIYGNGDLTGPPFCGAYKI